MGPYLSDQLRNFFAKGNAKLYGPARDLSRSPDQLEVLLDARTEKNHFGEHLIVRQWYPTPKPSDISLEALRLLFCRTLPKHHARINDADRWTFLDIETTGITKGKSTYAFLVGLAWWESGGLQVEQLFMRNHDEEHSVLLKVAQVLKKRPVLVTFNGKSCDWRLLEMRFRMTKEIDVPDIAMHLDFLHPARHLWRLQFGSLRLAEIERCVLNAEALEWSRTNDIDPTHIPSIYFDYLRGGPTEPLGGVFLHNRMDLRGLAALAVHVLKTAADAETITPHQDVAFELYGISRLLARNGEYPRARMTYERAIASGLPDEIDQKARYELAKLAKRQKDFDRAVALWCGLCKKPENLEAHEHLARHYERHVGDMAAAERVTRSGIAKLREANCAGLAPTSHSERLLAGFERRLIRLGRRAAN